MKAGEMGGPQAPQQVSARLQARLRPLLCSACLLGVKCRYDGEAKTHPAATPKLKDLLAAGLIVPVCPEQLGGLPTPRPPANVVGGHGRDVLDGKAKVLTVDGDDVTDRFIRGAKETLLIARMAGCARAVLKSGSPSCGSGDLSLAAGRPGEGDRPPVLGVTAALLKREGIHIEDEHSFASSTPHANS